MDGLLPTEVLHRDAPRLPVGDQFLHFVRVAQCVVLTVVKEGGRRHGTVPEDVQGGGEVVQRLMLERAEVEQAQAPHQAFDAGEKVFTQTCNT